MKQTALLLRLAFCVIAALFNGLDMGIQGNGNIIGTGLLIGFIVGLAWSSLLLFLVFRTTQDLRPPVKLMLRLISVFAAFAVLIFIIYHIWGER